MYVLEFIYLAIFCWCRLFEGIPIEWIRTEVGYAWRHTYWWDTYWVDAYTPTIFRKTLWRNAFRGTKKCLLCKYLALEVPALYAYLNLVDRHILSASLTEFVRRIWWKPNDLLDDWVWCCHSPNCMWFFQGVASKGRPQQSDNRKKIKGWQDHVPFISRRGLDLPSLTMQFTCNQSVMTWWQEFRFQTIADLRLRGRNTARWRDGSGQPP